MFESIRADLAGALSGVPVVSIEHIGSTAVPGLAAKPIIDVDVVVAADQLDAAVEAMVAAGYDHKGDLGISDRHAFDAPFGEPQRHVYVVVEGSLAVRNHLGVRDVLLESTDLRARYGALKLDLGRQLLESRTEYMIAKSALIQEMLAVAGLNRSELESIDQATRDSVPWQGDARD